MPHRYLEIDVFTDRPFYGNALAVIGGADDLSSDQMQRIANWTNCSETIFLLTPSQAEADYRVRIFTNRHELPFAGHPSLGAAYAVRHLGLVDATRTSLIQQCMAGLLPVRIDDTTQHGALHIQVPATTGGPVDIGERQSLEAALGAATLAAPWSLCNGPRWIVAELACADSIHSLQPDMTRLEVLTRRQHAQGVCVFAATNASDEVMLVRVFCPGDAVPEDPVTGSANAAIAAYLLGRGELDRYGRRYRASQGRGLGRDGHVEVDVTNDDSIWIGGRCVLMIDGTLLPDR